ncbi:carbohydrate ABC transporter permease [Agrobacterium sp. LAD9]|uniref:carbohydrate ABC transporter permease n=1 Tax=Agrobacterium sp. LAD9 TaxID=2055153 RepID=UPI000D1D86CC|nr:sugar ABC transporter permease [Agrobacterium sp. LAD9]
MRHAWLFLLPSLALLAAVLLWPFGYAIYMSLSDFSSGTSGTTFVGLKNYIEIGTDPRFWSALWTTSTLAFFALGVELTSGLLIALALSSLGRGAHAFVVAMFLPYIVTPVVSGLILKWMFVSNWGLIDATFLSLGVQTPDWLGDPFFAKLTVILADAWVSTPLVILILFAALQQVDSSQLEAARIDGGSSLQIARFVILPTVAPMLIFVASVRLMDFFRSFDVIYVLTGGGPGTATETLTMLTYQWGFRAFQAGKASALGLVTLCIVFAMIFLIATLGPRALGRSAK